MGGRQNPASTQLPTLQGVWFFLPPVVLQVLQALRVRSPKEIKGTQIQSKAVPSRAKKIKGFPIPSKENQQTSHPKPWTSTEFPSPAQQAPCKLNTFRNKAKHLFIHLYTIQYFHCVYNTNHIIIIITFYHHVHQYS